MDDLFRQLCQVIPGGVNSPFRAFDQVGGNPPVLVRGSGSHVWDAQGREYLDFCCAWGPILLGHAHPRIVEAGQRALAQGSVFGAPTPWELEFVTLIRQAVPSMEMIRLVNSGAEAVASALRVARGVTRRARILKFEGGYHGHVECLDAAGQEAQALGGALALGASPGAVGETLVATFNDLDSVQALFRQHPKDIAAVILEPVAGSMGVIAARPDFLAGLRRLCDQHGSLLIFDEVLSGFRVARGGAQELMPVRPDLTCLGKALAGGLPVGAFGGRADWMQQLAPLGTIYQAGTFCGNPVTVRCGIALLQELARPETYPQLQALTEALVSGLPPRIFASRVGAMFSLGFGVERLQNHHDAARLDTASFARFFHSALERGVYLPPSTLDAASLCLAHTPQEIDSALRVFSQAVEGL